MTYIIYTEQSGNAARRRLSCGFLCRKTRLTGFVYCFELFFQYNKFYGRLGNALIMNIAKKLKRTIVFLLKLALFASLFALFFGIFGRDNPWLLNLTRPSRTSGITMLTFAVLGIALMSVYGGYAIGTQKSKPIIYNMALATIITDFVTHFQLCIMNAGDRKYGRFVYEAPHLLLLVIVLQILVIVLFAYLGNYIYFSIEPPEKCCVISSTRESLSEVIPKIQRFKKQYQIKEILHYSARDIFEAIDRSDTIFLYDLPVDQRAAFVDYCFQHDKNIYYNFEMCDMVSQGGKFITLDDKSMVFHSAKDLTFEQRFFKRLIDIVFSLVGVIVTSPVMLLCALAVKCEDGGKVFYKQKRLTKNGRIFNVLKFRTMKEENSINKSVTENDDRITRVGNYLRKFRVDELPQLLNILFGDMTLVGPRPEMLENVAKYTVALPEFSYRLRVKAGLTGLAQISGKYNTSPKDKLVLDLMYIEKYSIWQDFKIMFQTVTVFFKASESTEAFKTCNNFNFDAAPDSETSDFISDSEREQ